MRRFISTIVIIAMVFVVFSGCQFRGNYIAGQGKRPTDFPNTKWVSEDPDIWFEIISSEEKNGPRKLEGVLKKDDIFINVNIAINPAGTFSIAPAYSGEGRILTGECEFYSDKLVVNIDKDSVDIFDGAYDTITFVKTEAGSPSCSKPFAKGK